MDNIKLNEIFNLEEILDELDIKINEDYNLPSFHEDRESYLQEMINNSQTGIFIYDSDLQLIVWGNQHFYNLNQIKAIHLFHPSIKNLFIRNLHEDDASFFKDNTKFSELLESDQFTSKIIRMKQKDGTYKFFLFSLFTPKCQISKSLGKVKIGKQTDLTPIIEKYKKLEIQDMMSREASAMEDFEKLSCLSPREKQILKLIVNGCTDKEIARQLKISFYTVEKHRKNIIKKLQVKNTARLSFLAGKCGIF